MLIAVTTSVAACMEPTKALMPLSPDALKQIRVAEVRVQPGAAEVPAQIVKNVHAFTASLVATCATGSEPHVLEVRIDSFKAANPAAVILVGDSSALAGQVRVLKPADGSLVGEYYIQEIVAGGGLIGLAVTSHADSRLPQAFARRICNDVFKQPPKE
jgi:hypothetical protein